MNRSISGADGERAAAAVEFAVNFVLADLAFGDDGHVEIDVAVAGVQVTSAASSPGTSSETLPSPVSRRQPAASVEPWVARTSTWPSPVFSSSSSKRPWAVMCPSPVEARSLPSTAFEIFGAVAAVQIHITLETGEIDLSVAGAQVDAAFARHLDNDVDPV